MDATATRAAHGFTAAWLTETVPLAALQPHPQNYKQHPPAQLAELAASIQAHGLYRNIVVARDNTILAGHGVAEAAAIAGYADVPVYRLAVDADAPAALQVLIGDNELARLALSDDRALTELLKALAQDDTLDGLLGTGFDATQVAALAYVTRPASEVADKNEAAHWLGMPTYEGDEATCRVIVTCPDAATRAAVLRLLAVAVADETPRTVSVAYPPHGRDDVGAVAFEG